MRGWCAAGAGTLILSYHSVHWSLYSNIRHVVKEVQGGASGKGTARPEPESFVLQHWQEHPELEGRRRRNANRRGPRDRRAGDLGSSRPTRSASALHRPERERAPGPSHPEWIGPQSAGLACTQGRAGFGDLGGMTRSRLKLTLIKGRCEYDVVGNQSTPHHPLQ